MISEGVERLTAVVLDQFPMLPTLLPTPHQLMALNKEEMKLIVNEQSGLGKIVQYPSQHCIVVSNKTEVFKVLYSMDSKILKNLAN